MRLTNNTKELEELNNEIKLDNNTTKTNNKENNINLNNTKIIKKIK